MKAAIVVPTIRHENISNFLRSWKHELAGHEVIIVEDNPERTFDLAFADVEHYSWQDIDEELGNSSWIIPRRTDCVRSFGFFKAWQRKVDFILSLDDDCSPVECGFLAKHWEMLNTDSPSPAWTSTVEGATPRGVPYFNTNRKLECVLNHGLWQNIPDYDAVTQLQNARQPLPITPFDQVIPRGTYFPMCGMNVAFKTMITPAMYFLLMGRDWPYDRFGDIWCGILAKRVCDHLGYGVKSGHPFVDHQRASNVWTNLRKETPGYEINETLWRVVDSAVLSGKTFADCYRELADQLALPGEYWDRLRAAMRIWADLFAQEISNRELASPSEMQATKL